AGGRALHRPRLRSPRQGRALPRSEPPPRRLHRPLRVRRGRSGMVMVVFTLPSYDMVFKVIRDRFAPPKQTTRRQVLERYELVFHHDRAGRLVDAQQFEHLTFPRQRFGDELLAELTEETSDTVTIADDRVVFRHLYVERRVRPLNLFLREAPPVAAR